jgi:tetraether lipid synthase
MLLPLAPPQPQTLLKTSVSLCPKCLKRVPATVFERLGKVYLHKSCPTHGEEEVLLASDAALYWNADEAAGPGCGTGCCSTNHSCSLVFEITEKCNLTCPTCFAGSSPEHTWHLPYDEFISQLDHLLANGKNGADMVQLSGGEPTVHPDLERMVEACFERNIQKIYINTNGVKLGTDPEFAQRLAKIDAGRDRLQFYLQFDGFEERTYAHIRGAKGLLNIKRKAIRNAIDAGLYVLPVMTVTPGINLHEIGDVWNLVREHHPHMNTLMLQPAFFSGRYDNDRSERLTMSEVAHEVVKQTDGVFSLEDFGPIPCSHPACFGLAAALVHEGTVIPVSRYFPRFDTWNEPDVAKMVARFSDRMPTHMLQDIAEDEMIEQLLDLLTGDEDSKNWADYKNFIMIGIKPFMDAHTFDQDRIDRCCVHIVDRAGEPVSLCEYNAIRRPQGLR